jgi:hypothetical protein
LLGLYLQRTYFSNVSCSLAALLTAILAVIEREKGGGVVRNTTLVGGGDGNIIFCLKVPRQCPLVLLIRVRYYFKVIEVGGAALERNLDRH